MNDNNENVNPTFPGQTVDALPEKIKILVVEDSVQMNLLYGKGLPDNIFEKRFAQNGQDGLSIYQEWQPDIVVLDVMLPLMSGYMVLKKIRELLKDKTTTIIMSTSLSKKEDVTAMVKYGIQGYIIKPFSIRDIGSRILKYYEKVDPARGAAALMLHDRFLEDLIRATFKMETPEKPAVEAAAEGAPASEADKQEEKNKPEAG